MKLTKRKREQLRLKFDGCCAYCGGELPLRGWQVNYIEPLHSLSVQVSLLENRVPACQECAQLKGTNSLEVFRSQIMKQPERAQRNSVNFRNAIRFGLISKNQSPVIFWFEKYINQKTLDETSVSKSTPGFESAA